MRRLAVTVVVLLAPLAARAGNGVQPRVPVEWPADTPCMTVVDRSQSPIVHLEYGIPYEDTEITPDEVPDSRRHQFIGFCRDHSPQEFVPNWLSWKDVTAASMTTPPQLDVEDIPVSEVLEESAVYKDCFWRINADDQRRPITFAEAAKGVEWDTTGLPAGAYVVEGYTWAPIYNAWWPRRGVFHVVDGPDLAAVGPAAALMNLDDYMFADDPLVLKGCARALPGSTLTGYWSIASVDGLDWKTFAVDVPLAGDTIELSFEAPVEAVNSPVTLRVDITDPMQRTYSTYASNVIGVLPGSSATEGDSGLFIGDSDGSSGGVTSGPGSTGGDVTTGVVEGSSGELETSGPKIDEPTGCGCGSSGTSEWGLLVLGLLVRRRRPLHADPARSGRRTPNVA